MSCGNLKTLLFLQMQKKINVFLNEVQSLILTFHYVLSDHDINSWLCTNCEQEAVTNAYDQDFKEAEEYLDTINGEISLFKDKLARAYKDALLSESAIDNLSYFALVSYIQNRLSDEVAELSAFNKLLDTKDESGVPSAMSQPTYMKRYQNRFFQEFLSKYTNDNFKNELNDHLGNGSKLDWCILRWEHRSEDVVRWSNKRFDPSVKTTLFLEESFWALDIPIYFPTIIHELGHYYYEAALHACKNEKQPNHFQLNVARLDEKYSDFMHYIGYPSYMPTSEYVCDLLGYIYFKESYIISLFVQIFAVDMHNYIDEDSLQSQNGKPKLIGGYPLIKADSWWVRLKSLCALSREHNPDSHYSDWVEAIDCLLNDFHVWMKTVTPASFIGRINEFCVFEESALDLVVKHLKNVYLTKNIKQLSQTITDREKIEYSHMQAASCNTACNEHMRKNCVELDIGAWDDSKAYSFFELASVFMLPFVNKLCDYLSDKEHEVVNSSWLSSINVPQGRLVRYIYHAFLEKEIPSLSSSNIKEFPSKLPEPVEMAHYKFRAGYPLDGIKIPVSGLMGLENEINDYVQRGKINNKNLQMYSLCSSYQYLLINVGSSCCDGHLSNLENGTPDFNWPEQRSIPYFHSVHSLIKIKESEAVSPLTDTIGFSIQIQLQDESRYTNYSISVSEIAEKLTRWLPDSYWALYSSLGWEDFFVIIEDATLRQIKDLKEFLFLRWRASRTITQPLWKGDLSSISGFDQPISLSGLKLTTLFRLKSLIGTGISFGTIANNFKRDLDIQPHIIGEETGPWDMFLHWPEDMSLKDIFCKLCTLSTSDTFVKYVKDFESRLGWHLG